MIKSSNFQIIDDKIFNITMRYHTSEYFEFPPSSAKIGGVNNLMIMLENIINNYSDRYIKRKKAKKHDETEKNTTVVSPLGK